MNTRTDNYRSLGKRARPRRALLITVLGVVSALPLTAGVSSGIATTGSTAQIACGSGMVCIYPNTGYGGVPYVRPARLGSTSLARTVIDDMTFSVINNSTRTARIYRSDRYTGSYTCIQPGGRIANLGSYAVGRWGSSLRINDDHCG